MQYSVNKKIGTVSAIIDVHTSKMTEKNIILDFDINQLRKRVGSFIKKQIKKIKPEGNIVGWETSIGDFAIYKQFHYDNWDIWKSKYRYTETVLEFNPKKGEILHRTISKKKNINPECEEINDCPVCNKKTLLEKSIIRQGEKLKVCNACKKFDNLLIKLEKQIDAEEKGKVKK